MLGRLMPREGKFFDLFNAHAERIVEGSRELATMIGNFSELEAHAQRIDAAERAADKITHETIALLHKTFITPFDRDQIHQLITAMDDILDLIQDVTEALQLYDIQRLTPEAVQLAELLMECCTRMQQAVKQLATLEDSARILKLCNEIDSLESQADTVMRTAISKLFREESDVRQLIKLETVYQLLEAATDQCEDVANIIEGVVLEHA